MKEIAENREPNEIENPQSFIHIEKPEGFDQKDAENTFKECLASLFQIKEPEELEDKKIEWEGEINPQTDIFHKEHEYKREDILIFQDGTKIELLRCYSTYSERIDQTPSETRPERGEWTGERGESKFIPADPEMKELLSQFGLDGIEYKDGIPDFSKCAAATVEIDNMTELRRGPGGNFEQCDAKCAEQWNKEAKDGKTDWTARDVANWRKENGYSWHERNDMKTCDLVPTKINDYFGHLGGVAECKKRDGQTNENGGEFDE